MTQEFHISVTPLGNDEYLVRTERVAPGVPLAEEQVTWPIEDWLAQARQLMNDPLTGILQGDRVNRIGGYELPPDLAASDDVSSLPPLSLAEMGQQLYSALFQGTLRDSWMTAQAIAQHRGEVLRLRLGLKGARLPRLPWEVLHESDSPSERMRQREGLSLPPRPLATGTSVVFSRYQPGTNLTIPNYQMAVESDQPLRILMAIAAPSDQKRLELKREAMHLQQELRYQSGMLPEGMAGTLPEIQLTILDQPGREQLTQALEQGQYQVLHYAGHSNLGASGGNLYLVNNKTGLTEILSGDDLAGLLANNGVRMAVFNSCRGAHTAAADPTADMGERNLAEALVGRGIPAVLAMAERIPDDVALTLSRLFYRNLKQGYPVDLSLSRARQGLISAYGSHQLYWALPILYLHAEFDGYLLAGDRTLDNPADRLMLIPQVYDVPSISGKSSPPLPTDAVPDSRYLEPADDWSDLPDSLFDDDLTEVEDGIAAQGYGHGTSSDLDQDDDLIYEEDTSVVAGLLQQLNDPGKATPLGQQEVLPGPQSDFARGRDASNAARRSALSTSKPERRDEEAFAVQTVTVTNGGRRVPRSLSASEEAQTASSSKLWQRLGNRSVVLILAAVGVTAIGLSTFRWFQSQRSPGDLLPNDSIVNQDNLNVPEADAVDLETSDTSTVTAIAISHFSKGELTEGEKAVAALLGRNALPEATAALATVPAEHRDQPPISYLLGRLAWQSVKVDDSNYSSDDARRYWEIAVKGNSDVAEYHIALGFAYQAEDKPSEAIQQWLEAIALMEAQQATTSKQMASNSETADISVPSELSNNQEALNAYAGIATTLSQVAGSRSAEEKRNLESKATKLYQMVIASDPVNFQVDGLSKSWLWTEETIRAWQELSALSQ